MAFIDDQLAVIGDDVGDFTLADQALNERDIDDAGRLSVSPADNTDLLWVNVQKGL